jgi:hypothetical protein
VTAPTLRLRVDISVETGRGRLAVIEVISSILTPFSTFTPFFFLISALRGVIFLRGMGEVSLGGGLSV